MKRLVARLNMAVMLTIVSASLIAATPVRAQDAGPRGDINLVTSPLPVLLNANPGTAVSTDLKIKNGSSHSERLRVDLLKFGAFGEDGQPRLLDPEPSDEQFKWVSLSQKTFDAAPNEWKTVKMTINVPKSAAFGYYYAVVFSRAGKEQTDGASNNVLKGGTAILVLLEANNPNAKKEMALVEFESVKGIYEFLPATFRVRVKNSGNVHLSPVGNIYLSQGDKNIGLIGVNPEKGNVLPDSFRVFESEWKDGFPHHDLKHEGDKVAVDGNGRQIKELKWNLQDAGKFRFGKYTASLTMIYDNGKRDIPMEAKVSFWVIPWRLILGALLVIGLMGAGAWALLRGALPGRRRDSRGRFARKWRS